jgi:alkylhydroperoxidase/carboxymuconolactone decarboxylase family protein YurZ
MAREFDLLLGGTPDIKEQFSQLRERVLWNGPLDAKCRAVAAVAVAMAADHPQLSDLLVWAKQAGMRNEEISHIAAVAAVLRAGAVRHSPSNGSAQPQPVVASCC